LAERLSSFHSPSLPLFLFFLFFVVVVVVSLALTRRRAGQPLERNQQASFSTSQADGIRLQLVQEQGLL
jgi:hypothetical protein